MSEDDLISMLRLIRSPGIGCVTFHQLLREYGSCASAIDARIKQKKDVYGEKDAYREIQAHKEIGAVLLSHTHDDYPPLLREIGDFPPLLSVLGNSKVLAQPAIAIVGARNASLHGIKFTKIIAEQLACHGYTIISGLARGVDGAAHQGALESGTVAVMAGGIDIVYPPEHKDLRDKILEKGAIISEMPLGLFPGASHFPRRNRIISGMSRGVCVMEASKPSGSLITAGYALDQGRDLFVVPGFPGDARCHGTNHLLKQGAYLLQSAEDVIDVLGEPVPCSKHSVDVPQNNDGDGSVKRKSKIAAAGDLDVTAFATITSEAKSNSLDIEKKLLESLSTHPLSLDELQNLLEISPQSLHDIVLNLELNGVIHRDLRGYIARVF